MGNELLAQHGIKRSLTILVALAIIFLGYISFAFADDLEGKYSREDILRFLNGYVEDNGNYELGLVFVSYIVAGVDNEIHENSKGLFLQTQNAEEALERHIESFDIFRKSEEFRQEYRRIRASQIYDEACQKWCHKIYYAQTEKDVLLEEYDILSVPVDEPDNWQGGWIKMPLYKHIYYRTSLDDYITEDNEQLLSIVEQALRQYRKSS